MSTTTAPSSTPLPFTSAHRVQTSVTASLEKRLLLWMAHRMPGWIGSDGLTLLGFAAQIATGLCYALSPVSFWWLLATIPCLMLNWFGDSLDGTLARVRNQQRPRYGFYVDHVVDIFGSAALLCGLGCSGLLHWQVALAVLVAFLLLAGESFLASYTLGRFEMSQGFFGPTELRLLLIAGNIAAMRSPFATVFRHKVLLFDLGGTIAAACMLATAVVVTVRHTAELYRQEPVR